MIAAPLPALDHEALIAEAERLARLFPWLLRLDFHLSPEAPVLGEITTFPNAGLGFTHFGRRTMLQMWEYWPDDRPAGGEAGPE